MINVKERETKQSATFLAAHFLRFRNGKIVDYRAIIDSLDAVRQMAGVTSKMPRNQFLELVSHRVPLTFAARGRGLLVQVSLV